MSNQKKLDRLHSEYKRGGLSRHGYMMAVNDVWSSLTDSEIESVMYRQDNRTLGQVALAFDDNTIRERFLLDHWHKMMGLSPIIKDLGICNRGRLILSPRRGENAKPDFKVIYDSGPKIVEVKFTPFQGFATFKKDDVYNYLRINNMVVITILADCKMCGGNGDPDAPPEFELPENLLWFPMNRKAIRRLIKIGEHDRHRGFGGKETIRVFKEDFRTLLKGVRVNGVKIGGAIRWATEPALKAVCS